MRPLSLGIFLALLSTSSFGATYTVTTNDDSGPGSLRQGILDANSGACAKPCLITFAKQDGLRTIEPLSPLPALTATGAVIAPDPPGLAWSVELSGRRQTSGSGITLRCTDCQVRAMIVNGFPESGILIEDSTDARAGSNIIGLDARGTTPIPNREGITIVRSRMLSIDWNTIGGNTSHAVQAIESSNVFLGGNSIGLQYLPQGSGDALLPNGGCGVLLRDVTGAQFFGGTITRSGSAGVAVVGSSSGVRIEDRQFAAAIYENGGLPIDLGLDGITPGAPVLTATEMSNGFMLVRGSVTTTLPNADVDINVFASDKLNALGTGELKTALAAERRKTDANGVLQFEMYLHPPRDFTGQYISATATTAAGTSEASAAIVAVTNNRVYTVLSANDSGAGSLRQAIVDANGGPCAPVFPCRIEFSLLEEAATIQPLTPLPPITRSGVVVDTRALGQVVPAFTPPRITIDGSRSTPGPGLTIGVAGEPVHAVVIRGLAIEGFDGDGILIDAGSGSIHAPLITDNVIGPNRGAGIRVRGKVPFEHIGTYGSGNRIVRNAIGGNGSHGVVLEGDAFFELDGNRIGTDLTGKLPLSNGGSGVFVDLGAHSHLEGNTIAFNRKSGVSIVETTPAAFNGLIQNAIHSNAGLEIDLRGDGALTATEGQDLQNPPEITSAVYDPATNVTTIKGTYTRTSVFSGWTPVIDFAVSTFPEADGRGSAEKPIYAYLTKTENKGGNRYSFEAAPIADLRGKLLSATATPFIFQGWVFGQGFQYGTTSEMSKAIPVATVGCPSAAPELVSPQGRIPFATSIELKWNAAPGASAYNVWIREAAGMPEIVATTSGTSATVRLLGGAYEWFVEALYGDCPSVKSQALPLEVMSLRRRAVR